MPPVFSEDSLYTNILISILNKNDSIELDEIESLVNLFIKQFNESIQVVYHNYKEYPSASLITWRTGYEIVVLFRCWAQSITINDDNNLFIELGQRFLDYSNSIRGVKYLSLDAIDRINNHPNHLKLEYTYDWLNPMFTKRELMNMYNENHPSFRDIVERTNETNGILRSMYTRYQDASNVIHFSKQSIDIISTLDVNRLIDDTNVLIFEFLMDYLTLVEKLNHNKKIQIYAKKCKSAIKKRLH